MSHRFFVEPKYIKWDEKIAELSDVETVHKIVNVLRLKEEDSIVLLDGKGLMYDSKVNSLSKSKVTCDLLSKEDIPGESSVKITVAQALIKGQQFDYALQKNTELGVFAFIPVSTSRTVVKTEGRVDRYQKIVKGASEQSERSLVPTVNDVINLEELCNSDLDKYDSKFICSEREKDNELKNILSQLKVSVSNVLILVGPEGGFTEDELGYAVSKGFIPISLGNRIYRAETASVVASTILLYHFGGL